MSEHAVTTGFVWDAGCLGYQTGSHRPENPGRVARLDPRQIALDLPGLRTVPIDRYLGLPWVRRTHEGAYVTSVQNAHRFGRAFLDGGDTIVTEDVFDVATLSASGALSLLSALYAGEVRNGFAAIRPPGHHAGPGHAKGFCVFNNVAICAGYARARLGARRVLIVDWDVHPADGTSAFFYRDPDVFVLSVHQKGIFGEGVGQPEERGRGEGEGTILNVPIDEGTHPSVWMQGFERGLTAMADAAKPDLVLVSCGFDAHIADPIGGIRLEDEHFRAMTEMVIDVAARHAGGRVMSVLEGGYNAAVLPRLVRAHVAALMDP